MLSLPVATKNIVHIDFVDFLVAAIIRPSSLNAWLTYVLKPAQLCCRWIFAEHNGRRSSQQSCR